MAMCSTSALNYFENDSTVCYSTSSASSQTQSQRYQQALLQQLGQQRQTAQQQIQSSPFQFKEFSGRIACSPGGAATTVKKGTSMVDEFKSYVREYKDWIFTMAIIAIIDHFFLDGALKEKLGAALGKKLEGGHDKAA